MPRIDTTLLLRESTSRLPTSFSGGGGVPRGGIAVVQARMQQGGGSRHKQW